MADNNQQAPDASRASSEPVVSNQTNPPHYASQAVTNLGTNEPKTMGSGTPFGGSNVSMTTGQPYGGPIVSTEQGKVSNETRPTA
jgi:hypothetical protein